MSFFGGGGTVGTPRAGTNPDGSLDMGGATGKGRKNVNNAPIIGTAITRQEYAAQQAAAQTPAPPPSTAAAASLAQGGAKSAAERQRKRAAAGEVGVAGAGKAGPGANLQAKMLIGS